MRTFAFILCFSLSLQASAEVESPFWFVQPSHKEAAQELATQLSALEAAKLHPHFTLLQSRLERATTQRERSETYLQIFRSIQGFWREIYQTPATELEIDNWSLKRLPLGEGPNLQFASGHSLLRETVALRPNVPNYRELIKRLHKLDLLTNEFALRIAKRGVLNPGSHHREIPAIRTQLIRLGDYPKDYTGEPIHQALTTEAELASAKGKARTYDRTLLRAVQQFQQRHGLAVDGSIGPDTRRWLTMSYQERRRLLARSLIKQSHDRHFFAADHLLVNIPAYRLDFMSQGESLFRTKVIVGRPTRRTPRMHSEINNIVVNPYWNVPRSILRKDLLPKIKADGSYVKRHRYEVLDNENRKLWLSPQQLSHLARQGFPYRLRQLPGTHNALGQYKFHLVNKKAIYLHDTSQKRLFSKSRRAFSSGCIRVQDADVLANMLLQTYSPQTPDASRYVGGKSPRWLKLNQPIAAYLVYWSAWMEDGLAHFRDDIYNLDQRHKNNIALYREMENKISP